MLLRAWPQAQTNRSTLANAASVKTRPRPAVGRSRLLVLAFRDVSDVRIRGPTYYQLLQVKEAPGSNLNADAINAAFESILMAPTQAAYSEDTLFSRAVLLKSAAGCLSDVDLKRGYDQKLEAGLPEVKVSQADLPGAMVLLQEAGEYQLVIDLAATWLQPGWLKQADVPDVATCLALALCDRAGATLTEAEGVKVLTTPTVQDSPMLRACHDLGRALDLCKEHDVAHALQDHITDALQGYAHLHAVELLSLPMTPQHTHRRQQGIRLLSQVLNQALPAEAQAAKQHQTKVDTMVRRARSLLTAAEQIQLQKYFKAWADKGEGTSAGAGVAYDSALAYLAEGWSQGWPHYVHCADVLFSQAEGLSGEAGAITKQSPVALERACCAFLLGDVRTAQQTLGLLPGSPFPADPEVVTFIKANSKGSSDLMPGLTALTQSWLSEAVLAEFPEWRGRVTASTCLLDTKLNRPMASIYRQVRAVTQFGPLLAFIQFLCVLPSTLSALTQSKVVRTTSQPTTPASATLKPSPTSCVITTPPSVAGSVMAMTIPTIVPTASTTSHHTSVIHKPLKLEQAEEGEGHLEDSIPEQPIIAVSELMQQSETMTVNQLVGRLPKGLMPLRRVPELEDSEKEGSPDGGPSQTALRLQLDQMEKAMWDASPETGKSAPSGLLAGLPMIVGMVVVVGMVLSSATQGVASTRRSGALLVSSTVTVR